jgi:hypothetical protein
LLERDLQRAPAGHGLDERLLRLRLLRLRRDEIEHGNRPNIQAHLIVPHQLRRRVHRLPGDVDGLDREHKIPVRFADAR